MITIDQARLRAAFLLATREILEDMASGQVPLDVRDFYRLHDYVDANYYGGLFDIDDLSSDETVDFGNELQNKVDRWLKAGRPDPEAFADEEPKPPEAEDGATTVHVPGAVYATYKDGEIEAIVFEPDASRLGYFGPSASVWSGDQDLDVETDEGPFWQAMQRFLAEDPKRITWTE